MHKCVGTTVCFMSCQLCKTYYNSTLCVSQWFCLQN